MISNKIRIDITRINKVSNLKKIQIIIKSMKTRVEVITSNIIQGN